MTHPSLDGLHGRNRPLTAEERQILGVPTVGRQVVAIALGLCGVGLYAAGRAGVLESLLLCGMGIGSLWLPPRSTHQWATEFTLGARRVVFVHDDEDPHMRYALFELQDGRWVYWVEDQLPSVAHPTAVLARDLVFLSMTEDGQLLRLWGQGAVIPSRGDWLGETYPFHPELEWMDGDPIEASELPRWIWDWSQPPPAG